MLWVNQYAYTLGNPVWFADPSGRNFEAVLGGILATSGLAAATASLFLVGSAAAALLAGLGMTLGGLGFALWVARALSGEGSGSAGFIIAGPGRVTSGAPGRASGATATGSCSPVRLASVPGLGYLHWILIAAQILLAPLLIRSWSARRRRRSP